MVNAYSLGPLNFCGNALPTARALCNINYKIPGITTKFSALFSNDIVTLTNGSVSSVPASQVTSACKAEIQNFYCRLFFPSCDAAAELITYNLPNCTNYGKTCPKKVYDNLHRINICQVVPSGSFRTDVCVKPNVEGTKICPKPPAKFMAPQWLRHEDRLNDRSIQGINLALKYYNVSASCTKTMQQYICGSQLFCSPDKTKVLTTATRRTCQNALKW